MINTVKKYKRGFAFIDIEKEQQVWLYRIKSETDYLVSTDPSFENANDMYEAKLNDLKELHQKRSSSIRAKAKVLSLTEKQDKNDLTAFFDSLSIPECCQECGAKLMAFNNFGKRSCCCHVLPKNRFEEIATNELNIVFMGADFLGGCPHHDFWDSSVENRMKMIIYPLALKRFELLKEFLPSEKIIEAWDYLGIKYTSEMIKELK